MKLSTALAGIGLACALVGCAGTRFSFDAARKVTPGMTEAEVVNLMGKPYSVVARPDQQIWVWSQANGMTGSHQSVSIGFRDGKVITVPTIPDSFR